MSSCPLPKSNPKVVKLSEGSGGLPMQHLIDSFTKNFPKSSKWQNTNNDSATFPLGDQHLVFTTDSFVVTPLFFPGGNIGKIAFCGTVNDLAMMGADPIGLSLGLIIEEGFLKKDLTKITDTIAKLSKETNIPIVTGDTKVMEKGSIDKIVINTSGVGLTDQALDKDIKVGDQIIISGPIGEHGAALLAQRFDMTSSIITDSQPLHTHISKIKKYIKQAKDITRGGLAAILNEIADNCQLQLDIDQNKIPISRQVNSLTEILGLDPLELACEGRFACVVTPKHSDQVLTILRKFDKNASIIGQAQKGKGVVLNTDFGSKILHTPTGNIVPRIC